MNNVQVDARLVLNAFAELSPKKQLTTYKKALKTAANVLVRETRSQLKKEVPKSKTMKKGIKAKVNKEGSEAKVHIMGDYRLKFFEKGTNERLTKKGYKRGAIKEKRFFLHAQLNKEREIFDNMDLILSESIKKVAKL